MILDVSVLCITLAGAVIALNAKELMRGVLGMAMLFAGIAGFFASMGAWFLAAAQLFLFVGGVATLLVLAFNMAPTPPQHVPLRAIVRWSLVPLALAGTLALFLPSHSATAAVSATTLATALFGTYGWLISVALLLLLGALIGAQYLLGDA